MSGLADIIAEFATRAALHAKAQEVIGLIDQMTQAAEYKPTPEAAAELDRALALLIREYERQGYECDEKAEWTCRGLVIGGEAKGDWRITLQRVDAYPQEDKTA